MAYVPPVGQTTDPDIFLENVKRADELVNGPPATVPDRGGEPLYSWRQIMAMVAAAIVEAQNSITAIGLPFTTYPEAQAAADNGKIPVGAVTWVRNPGDASLADEYINNGGTLEATGREMPSQQAVEQIREQINHDTVQILKTSYDKDGNIYLLLDEFGELFIASLGPVSVQEKFRKLDTLIHKDRAGNLHEFPDKNANVPAFIDELGDLYISGLGPFSVAQKIKAIESSIVNNDEKEICHQYDFNGRLISFQDAYGELFVPGLDKSVQESIKDIRQNYQRDSAPQIRRLTDAQSRALEFTDEEGRYYLKGFGAKSLEEHFDSLKKRVNTLYKAKAIFDAWLDFGIDWNGNESVSLQLQTAVNYVSKLPYGGEIVFRPGVYRLHTYITAKPNVTIRCITGAVFMPMLANAAFYYRSSQEIYLENFNLIDIEIDGAEQHSPSYDVGAKGTYLQYFRQCMFLRCNVHDTGATGIGNDYPDRSFVLDCYTDNCGRLAPDGSGGASGIGIGLGAMQDEALIVARAITRNCKNFGMFFEQQRLSGPGQPYVSRQIIVSDAVCTGNGHGFGDCGASGLVVVNGQFNDNLKTGISIDAGTLANNGIAPRPGKNGLMLNCQAERNGVTGLHYDSTKIQADGGYSFSEMHINDNAQDAILIEAGANTLADVRFDNMDIKNNGRYPVNVASGVFTDLDFTNLRMLRNGGDTAFKLDGNITRGSIHGCKLRSQNGAAAITGAGTISHFDIAENQYTDTNSNPINLTGTLTNVTYGRNPGLKD
ncbi:right-handed parallel beta-helix repeat-containing protein [Klebsiella quasipneumoniae]|uniref:right-handed parallel beta-helix repeat-containing protein n=1 Tax=Klebsiella quasipneumoniae TaxID=1463165 RepID=UPI002F2676BF